MLTPITSVQPAKDNDQRPAHTDIPTTQNQPPPVPPVKPVFPYTQAQCPTLQISHSQPEMDSLETCAAEERLVSSSARNSLSPESRETIFQADSGEWPPPYLSSEYDVCSVNSLNLPELPPPPPPDLDPESGVDLSPSGSSLTPVPTEPEDSSTSPSSYRKQRQFGKFPVNFYIPASPSARRPSELSHYDNLSEEEEQSGGKIPENQANQENSGPPSQPWPTPPSFFYIPDTTPALPPKPAKEHSDARNCVKSNCTFLQTLPEFANQLCTVSSSMHSNTAVRTVQNQNNVYSKQLQSPRLPIKPAALSSGPTPVCADFNRMHVPNPQPPKPVT